MEYHTMIARTISLLAVASLPRAVWAELQSTKDDGLFASSLSMQYSVLGDSKRSAKASRSSAKSGKGTKREHPPSPSYVKSDCINFAYLGFDVTNFDQYEQYFDETSAETLAQTGEYVGVQGIEEYNRFITPDSPYIEGSSVINGTIPSLAGFDSTTGTCKFRQMRISRATMNETFSSVSIITWGASINMYYSIPNNNIAKIDAYYTPEYSNAFFSVIDTPETRKFVCDVLASPPCADVLAENDNISSVDDCVEELGEMVLAEGDLGYADGYSRSCRMLHAAFVVLNSAHCPHISFVPVKDADGKIKCQTSKNILPSDLFADSELDDFERFCIENIGNPDCYIFEGGSANGTALEEQVFVR